MDDGYYWVRWSASAELDIARYERGRWLAHGTDDDFGAPEIVVARVLALPDESK